MGWWAGMARLPGWLAAGFAGELWVGWRAGGLVEWLAGGSLAGWAGGGLLGWLTGSSLADGWLAG